MEQSVRAFLILVLSLFAVASEAALIDSVPVGEYNDGYNSFTPKSRYQLRKRGSKVALVDRKREITYILDLNAQGEQDIGAQMIRNFYRKSEDFGRLGRAVKRVTVSDIRPVTAGVKANLNYYIRVGISIASLEYKIAVPVETIFNNCSIGTINGVQGTTCIKSVYGKGMKVSLVKSGVPIPAPIMNGIVELLNDVAGMLGPQRSVISLVQEAK